MSLNQVAVTYSGPRASPKPHRLGGIWPLGFTAWRNVEGMAVVFTLKQWIVVGPLHLRAVRLAGLRAAARRRELFDAPPKGETTRQYARHLLRLFVRGVPFRAVGDRVRLLRADPERNVVPGAFTLTRVRR